MIPPPGRPEIARVAALAILLGSGPTVGDVGACGRQATTLDRAAFAGQRKATDCRRCTECGLTTQTCNEACDPHVPPTASWPATCHPLSHDGEVCIDALESSGCSDYASFVEDRAPTLPTECDFCHEGAGDS